MEELYKDFEKLQSKFHDTIEKYPLFQEQIDNIFDVEVKEIEDLLDKNDEFYLKKAIKKLDNLIDYVKKTSIEIDDLYKEYEKLVNIWEQIGVSSKVDSKTLNKINNDVLKANELINNHVIKDIKEAVKLLSNAIKELKEYSK